MQDRSSLIWICTSHARQLELDFVHTLLDGREIILMIQVNCKSFRMVATLVPKPDQDSEICLALDSCFKIEKCLACV
jgi:hypothetical protein